MAYYQGDYYSGDYYSGDPGIFGAIGGALKGFFGGGPIGAVGGAVRGFKGKRKVQPMYFRGPVPVRQLPGVRKVKGLSGFGQRVVPGGRTGFEFAPERRRRMNVANPKALRRAIRRQQGFVKLARRALKGTGYTIVTRGSRRPQRPLRISEKGPGSVVVT